jgi:hypothetical protein
MLLLAPVVAIAAAKKVFKKKIVIRLLGVEFETLKELNSTKKA